MFVCSLVSKILQKVDRVFGCKRVNGGNVSLVGLRVGVGEWRGVLS